MKIEEIELKIQSGNSLTQEELDFIWNYKTGGLDEKRD